MSYNLSNQLMRNFLALLSRTGGNRGEQTNEMEQNPLEAAPAAPASSAADRSRLADNELLCEFATHNAIDSSLQRRNVFSSLNQRSSQFEFAHRQSTQRHLSQFTIPNSMKSINHYESRTFSAQYSHCGGFSAVASQDSHVRIYSDSFDWRCVKDVQARHVGWSIVDVDFSRDSRFLIYSTWSRFVQMTNVSGDYEIHEPLAVAPHSNRVCLFSIKFSPDGREILAGSNSGSFFIYDIHRNERVIAIEGHTDDINSVCFGDEESNLIATASDDGAVKVWDRRTLGLTEGSCIGQFIGNCEGISHVSARGDARYFLTNGKDQAARLWDIRKMSPPNAEPLTEYRIHNWDYRWEIYPGIPRGAERKDGSLMRYQGHRVLETLIRAGFSPMHSTGSRYIYTGSQSGGIFIYDLLTGEIVKKLIGHTGTCREVSWHPYESKLISASWDQTAAVWEFKSADPENEENFAEPERNFQHLTHGRDLFNQINQSDDEEEEEEAEEEEEIDENADDEMNPS